jgi:hypothetical protein
VRESEYFDARIARFQKKKGIDTAGGGDLFHKLLKQNKRRGRKKVQKPVPRVQQSGGEEEEAEESNDENGDEENAASDDSNRTVQKRVDKPGRDKKRKTDSGERVEKRKKAKQSREVSSEVLVISEDENHASPSGEGVEKRNRDKQSKEGSPDVIVISEEDERPEKSTRDISGDENRVSPKKKGSSILNDGIETNVTKDPAAPSGSDATSEPTQDDGEEVDELVESVRGEDGEVQPVVAVANGGDNTNEDQRYIYIPFLDLYIQTHYTAEYPKNNP